MPRPPRHPFTAVLRRALGDPSGPAADAYLKLLDLRFATLARIAAGAEEAGALAMDPRPRRLARRFLAAREDEWNDGDENLVRGYLDRWAARGERADARARGLLEAASALAALRPPPGALWFFLWEMESVLAGLLEADKGVRPC